MRWLNPASWGGGGGDESVYRRDTIPGVYLQATAVNDLLRQELLKTAEPWQRSLLMAFSALLVCLLVMRIEQAMVNSFAMLGLLSGMTIIGVYYLQQGLMLPVMSMQVAAMLSFALILIYRYAVADTQKKRIRNLFSLYLQPDVVDRMVNSEQLPTLGGEIREVTVWFSDLANFTSLSEGLEANELVGLMNLYFTAVTDIIESHGGFVDKYIGDAVVAVFGAPHDDPHHAGHAVAAALTVTERLQQMNKDGYFGGREIIARTGINTGQAVVGNVGSVKRFNYTVMGDTVNLASRLEGANKAMETHILISEAVAERLPNSIIVREVGMIRVKGKQKPTRVFEPLTMRSWRLFRRSAQKEKKSLIWSNEAEDTPEIRPISGADEIIAASKVSLVFSEAQMLYRMREFEKVIALLEPYANDPPSALMISRAKARLESPPPEDWDGVEVLNEK